MTTCHRLLARVNEGTTQRQPQDREEKTLTFSHCETSWVKDLTLRRASAVITYCFSTHSAPNPKTFPLGSFDSHSAGWDECWAPLKFQWQETFPSVRPQLPLMIWKACVGKASGINKPSWEENQTNFENFWFGDGGERHDGRVKGEKGRERQREGECQGQALLIWRLN